MSELIFAWCAHCSLSSEVCLPLDYKKFYPCNQCGHCILTGQTLNDFQALKEHHAGASLGTIDDIIVTAQASIRALEDSKSITTETANFIVGQLSILREHAKNIEFADEAPTAVDISNAGIKHMSHRAATYDSPKGERSMAATVTAFNALAKKDLTEEQGWLFMEVLKCARCEQGDFKLDNYEDGSAYASLKGEAGYRERVLAKKSGAAV